MTRYDKKSTFHGPSLLRSYVANLRQARIRRSGSNYLLFPIR